MRLKTEVDTAVSHNIISKFHFDALQHELAKRGFPRTKKLKKGVRIRLADGSLAEQVCPVVQLEVSTDLDNMSNNPLSLTFLVVEGPNNLIGRHALARMWPNKFNRFKQATCANFVKPYSYDNSKQCDVIEANKIQSIRETKQKSKPKSKPKTSSKKGSKGTFGNSALNPAGKGVPAQNARALEARVHEPRPPPLPLPRLLQQTGQRHHGRPGGHCHRCQKVRYLRRWARFIAKNFALFTLKFSMGIKGVSRELKL